MVILEMTKSLLALQFLHIPTPLGGYAKTPLERQPPLAVLPGPRLSSPGAKGVPATGAGILGGDARPRT